jgi:hypothetical protein
MVMIPGHIAVADPRGAVEKLRDARLCPHP